MKEKINNNEWYNSGSSIVSLIVCTIVAIIIFSQSYANGGENSLTLFGSVINHNVVYFLVLIYFVFLKTNIGKQYFNYLNILLIFIYFINFATSLLTVVQSFSLNTVFVFTLNFLFVVYMIHTFFRGTRFWKEFRLYNSPFNELSNDCFFYSIVVLSIFLLIVNLILTAVFSGVVISLLDTLYFILLGRYIYIYRKYLDDKKIDVDNDGNFDELRENVKKIIEMTNKDLETAISRDGNINKIEENKINVESSDTAVVNGDVIEKSVIVSETSVGEFSILENDNEKEAVPSKIEEKEEEKRNSFKNEKQNIYKNDIEKKPKKRNYKNKIKKNKSNSKLNDDIKEEDK